MLDIDLFYDGGSGEGEVYLSRWCLFVNYLVRRVTFSHHADDNSRRRLSFFPPPSDVVSFFFLLRCCVCRTGLQI